MRLGILGAGTVGGALLQRLSDWPRLAVAGVLVRDPERTRPVGRELLTTDPAVVLEASDVIVELMGGTDQAGDLMLQALSDGKPVVTANKAVLAERWAEFLPFIRRGLVHFEASVMAGTPAVAALGTVLRAGAPLELHAILNGTCSFMLTRLEQGEAFDTALAEAQRLGYAEADPTLDIGGIDAAHKLAILARMAFDPELRWEDVLAGTQGITHLTPAIVHEAMEDGGSVALLGSITSGDGRWNATVRPVYLPADHAMRVIDGSRNGLLFRGRDSGEVMLLGPGAGGATTASAVLADLLQLLAGRPGPAPLERAAVIDPDYVPEQLGELLRS